ncbi:MAG: rod shape-determining protein [Clostridia bacterium]|nr:rod shape-determining protein [Clostridia bacterium]
MSKVELAIKFGSNEIIVFRKGFGVVDKVPAYLAVIENGKKIQVKATGKEAEKMFHAKSSNVTVYQPIVNSEIINEKMAGILLEEIVKNVVTDRFLLTSINVLVAVPCALNEQQLIQIKKVLHSAGVNKVNFVQNGVCARANLDIDTHSRIMVVDIGKYITDISVLNDYNFDFGRMYFLGGENMDESLTSFIQDNYNLEVNNMTSEAIKNEIASLYDRDLYRTEYIGIDENNKFVKNEITASEVKVAIVNIYDKIFELINQVLKELPKDIVADIYNNGVMFVGGASQVAGLYEYAKKKLDLPIIVPDEPQDYVIMGAGKLLRKDSEFIKINL